MKFFRIRALEDQRLRKYSTPRCHIDKTSNYWDMEYGRMVVTIWNVRLYFFGVIFSTCKFYMK